MLLGDNRNCRCVTACPCARGPHPAQRSSSPSLCRVRLPQSAGAPREARSASVGAAPGRSRPARRFASSSPMSGAACSMSRRLRLARDVLSSESTWSLRTGCPYHSVRVPELRLRLPVACRLPDSLRIGAALIRFDTDLPLIGLLTRTCRLSGCVPRGMRRGRAREGAEAVHRSRALTLLRCCRLVHAVSGAGV